MQITPHIINIPPYLSTPWENVASLRTQVAKGSFTLFVTLKSGDEVQIPNLDQPSIDAIFKAHAEHVERPIAEHPFLPTPLSFNLPLDKMDGHLPSFGASVGHNPEQSNLPDVPPEVLEKITIVAKAFGLDDPSSLPPPVELCNCFHCQIMRTFQGLTKTTAKEIAVSEEDLRFRDWEIKQTADQLYKVTNPLDTNEHYNVFLGDPLGCTCGQKNCEHIKAVLHS